MFVLLLLTVAVFLSSTVIFIIVTSSLPPTIAVIALCIYCIAAYCILLHQHYQEEIADPYRRWWYADRCFAREQRERDLANGIPITAPPSTFLDRIFDWFLDVEYEYYLRTRSDPNKVR